MPSELSAISMPCFKQSWTYVILILSCVLVLRTTGLKEDIPDSAETFSLEENTGNDFVFVCDDYHPVTHTHTVTQEI